MIVTDVVRIVAPLLKGLQRPLELMRIYERLKALHLTVGRRQALAGDGAVELYKAYLPNINFT